MPPAEKRPSREGESDVVGWIAEYLQRTGPRFVVLAGPAGAGKSSLLRALFPRLSGEAIFLIYQQPTVTGPDGQSRPQVGGATTLLLADPHRETMSPPPRSEAPLLAGLVAGERREEYAIPPPFRAAIERMTQNGGGCMLLDSWDRDSERFVRGLVPDPSGLTTFSLPSTEFGTLQSAILGMKNNVVLAVIPELAASLQSLADAVINLREETRNGARVRLVSVPKSRGSGIESRDHLYTLEQGRFRSLADLPAGFSPPSADPDPDPEPTAGTLWPGSAAFADAFGRLKHGAMTALTLSPDVSDPLATAIVQPLVVHALRAADRVVWMPAPALRPSKAIALVRERVPVDWVRERLRVISASGDDPGLGELAGVVLPLRRAVGTGGDLRAATSPGVGPIFPDAHKFLRMTPEASSALYVMSIEGLKASAAAAGVALNVATLPVVLAAYARLPRFHGFGYGQANDPVAAALLPVTTTTVHLQVVCGRPVLHGERPRTPAFAMDWPTPDGRYTLLPCQ